MGNLFYKIPEEAREPSEKCAQAVVVANPKLVKQYLEGHSALTVLTAKAMEGRTDLDERYVAEYIIIELEKLRGPNRKP